MASLFSSPNSSKPLNPYAHPFTTKAVAVLPPPVLLYELRNQTTTTVIPPGFYCPPGQHLSPPFWRRHDVYRVCSWPLWPNNGEIGGFNEPCVQEKAGMEDGSRRPVNWSAKKPDTDVVPLPSCSSSTVVVKPEGDMFCGKTTSVMIKNIPNRFKSHTLINILDKHCLEENRKSCSDVSEKSNFVRSEYDFLYLPMDFRRQTNKGYAFVNFTSAIAASRFAKAFDKYQWKQVSLSKKICQVTVAKLQGKDAFQNHFNRSTFLCRKDSYLPSMFSPPRDGFVRSPPTLVGRRV